MRVEQRSLVQVTLDSRTFAAAAAKYKFSPIVEEGGLICTNDRQAVEMQREGSGRIVEPSVSPGKKDG